MPPTRPLLQRKGSELEAMFEEAGNDLDALRLLKAELAHRNVPKMVALRRKVEDQIAVLRHTSAAPGKKKLVSSPATPRQGTLFGNDTETAPASPPPSPPAPTQAKPSVERKVNSGTAIKGGARVAKLSEKGADPNSDSDLAPGGGTATIRPRGHLVGTPPRSDFRLETDLNIALDASAKRAAVYQTALTHLIAEMKKKGAGVRTVALTNGKRVTAEVGSSLYEFPFEGDEDLFEGAVVTAQIGGRQVEGSVVAVAAGRTLTVALKDDCGAAIPACTLRIDNTAMLEALRARMEALTKGEMSSFNDKIADALIENSGTVQPPDRRAAMPRMKDGRALRERQEEAVRTALSNPVFFLWGPPGTGKTFTLSALVDLLFQAGKRILICSNTNQAVDQVLLSLCSHLQATNEKLLDDGAVIRIGRIVLDRLEKPFGKYINVDGIKARKAAELQRRRSELQEDLNRLDRQFARAKQLANAFRSLDQLKAGLAQAEKATGEARKAQATAESRLSAVVAKGPELAKELETTLNASILRRMLKRSADAIRTDIARNQTEQGQARADLEKARTRLMESGRAEQSMRDGVASTEATVRGVDRRTIERQIADHDSQRQPIQAELNDIARKIDEIEKTAMDNARIIGATVTKLYLSPKIFSNFDVVIVDEVSMVILPALYHAAGLAKEKVVVSGDPRQLSPIVQTSQQAIHDLIGRDVFEEAGIAKQGVKAPRTVMLDIQNRMVEPICRLVSGNMYDGQLKTERRPPIKGKPMPAPFGQALTIIDTSSTAPFVNRDPANSRYNIMNALAVRNLVQHLRDQGVVSSGDDIGICTPFAAQAKLLQRVLENTKAQEAGGGSVAGTVHRFQGDERRAMVIDIPDSHGEQYAGVWLQADNADLLGAKLFNVAVTRAQDHLIFLANLRYLDKRLPGYSFLRGMLHAAQEQGRVVDVRDVLNYYPIANDLRHFGTRFNFDTEDLVQGWYNERTFGPVFEADLAAAEKTALIVSGFVTPQRVAAYEALVRRKTAEGVQIRCITRPPDNNGSIPPNDGKDALDGLEAMGCVVDTRFDTHQKAIIIDGRIVWYGSLNPLSHTTRTGEMMTRIENPAMAQQLSDFLALRGLPRGDGTGMQKECPVCPNCGGRTAARHGKHGLYFICETMGCWQGNHPGSGAGKSGSSLNPDNAPECPECGGTMRPRTGRYGDFWGCSNYPKCNGIVNPSKKAGVGGSKKRASGLKAKVTA